MRAELIPDEAAVRVSPAPADDGWPDLADVRGQAEARRALEIAVAGGHALLMIGAPGSGKTLLARTIRGLLPPLDPAEAQEATVIASVAGEGPVRGFVTRRPFRAPHHTASYAALVGGGPRMSPGEVTRAHHGVLFLDELPEFDRAAREALRQPLEEGRIAIARAGGAVEMPARFQLVAAMNPCPCGWAADPSGRCTCPLGLPDRYAARISGPFRDRLDLWVGMPRVAPEALLAREDGEASAPVAARVAAVWAHQVDTRGRIAGRLTGRALRAACRLDSGAERAAIRLADAAGLTARATERLLRVSRTIADLDGAERVAVQHLEEAARYRVPATAAAAERAG
jgi:magnesium chelatase family protein